MANLAGVCREKLELILAPSALKIMMNEFYAKAILSQGTPIWSFMGKWTTQIFILIVAIFCCCFNVHRMFPHDVFVLRLVLKARPVWDDSPFLLLSWFSLKPWICGKYFRKGDLNLALQDRVVSLYSICLCSSFTAIQEPCLQKLIYWGLTFLGENARRLSLFL